MIPESIKAYLAHILVEDGITPVLFRRGHGNKWTNAEPFSLPPGGVLWFGPGHPPIDDLVIFPGETLTVEWTYA